MDRMPTLNRRALLAAGGATALLSAGGLPRMAVAKAPTDARFLFVIQRGAADGIAIVPPVGDPAYVPLRGALAAASAGGATLDGYFHLHPELKQAAAMIAAREGQVVHAVGTAYHDRSHFDGQNVLESGGTRPYGEDTGWINRLLALLPGRSAEAMAIAPAIPLALRGPRPVANYAPNVLPAASEDLMARVSDLYAQDAALAGDWAQALKTRSLAGDIGGNNGANGAALGELAASLLGPADGARVMMLETGGWDTHGQQPGRLAAQLRGLDAMLGATKAGLGPAWASTLVLVATEFGRTAAVNGTMGTDHGTGAAALWFGGALTADRPVVADWPGLAKAQLFEGRDLRVTTRFEPMVAARLAAHYGLDEARVRKALFPGYVA